MSKQPTYDVSKLPKWAQTKIEVLEKNVAYWKAQAQAVATKGETEVFLVEYPNSVPLPPKSRVEFRIGDYSIQVQVSMKGYGKPSLEVYGSGGVPFSIRPWSSNIVLISQEDR